MKTNNNKPKVWPFVQGWVLLMLLIFFCLVAFHYMGLIHPTNVSGVE